MPVPEDNTRLSPVCRGLATACSWGWLVLWSLWRYPVPGINEPHYLGKARHFWDPSWCPGDFFLDSSNPHWTFYATFGLLTQIVSFPWSAILGRIIGFAIVAVGWQRLSETLTRNVWGGLTALGPLLLLQAMGSWSGEWLARGIESKVPAYGFLFWGLGDWLSGHPRRAGILIGLAVAFHPLVGMWGALCVCAAELVLAIRNPVTIRGEWGQWIQSACLFSLAALPGLLPAISTLATSHPDTSADATLLLVANRLKHHLDPTTFPLRAWLGFAAELIGFCLFQWGWQKRLRAREESSPPQDQRLIARRWGLFIIMTVLVAVVGVLLGWGPRPMAEMPGYRWRCELLKFYPFRLADLMVPVGLSLSAAALLLSASGSGLRSRSLRGIVTGSMLLATVSLVIPGADQNPSQITSAQQRAWRAACDWLQTHTSSDALVYATGHNFAVKWFAERPEYVNYKDLPQDPDSTVEWNRRLWVIYRWSQSAGKGKIITRQDLADLRSQTGIRYLISGADWPVESGIVFDGPFRVIELPE